MKSTLYVYAQSYRGEKPQLMFSAFELENCDMFTHKLIETQEIEHKSLDSVDMNEEVIQALKAEKQKVLAEAQVKANELDERINSLLAIEHKKVA